MNTKLHYGLMQPLRFYENIEHQNRHRRVPGADLNHFKLLYPQGYIPPFQIKRDASPAPILAVSLYRADGVLVGDMDSYIVNDQLVIINLDDSDYIVHFGSVPLDSFTAPADGDYYFSITSGGDTWYSEIITYKTFDPSNLDLDGCVLTKVTFWSTCDVADIFYRTVEAGYEQYKSFFYLDTTIHAPEWEHEDEGTKDGEGNFYADFVQSTKSHLIEGIYPEYFLDVLNTLPQYMGRNSTVEISTAYGYTSAINQVLIDPQYTDKTKIWAQTKVTFSVGFFFTTNCCDSAGAIFTGCIREAKDFVAFIVAGSSDWLNYEYFNEEQQIVVPLVENDLVMVEWFDGTYQVRRYTGTGFTPPLIDALNTSYQDANFLAANYTHPVHHVYYYNNNFTTYEWDKPTINLVDNGSNNFTVNGLSWYNCWVEVKTYDLQDGFTTVATGTATQYRAGLSFYNTNDAESVFVFCRGVQGCFLGQSENRYLPSSGFCLIGSGLIDSCVISN